MAVRHVARLAVGHQVAILQGLAVVRQLVHLAAVVLPLVDLHPELPPVLLEEDTASRTCLSQATTRPPKETYRGDHATGAHGVHHRHAHHAHHAPDTLEIRVLASLQEHLVAHEAGVVVGHEAAILHPAGVAAVKVRVDVGAVAATVVGPTLEVPLLVENDLRGEKTKTRE